MLIIEVKPGEKIDRALKRFKRKAMQTKLVIELREREYFEKPSVKKRWTKKHAIYVNHFRIEESKE